MVTKMVLEGLRSALRSILRDEEGAVTIDWVVLSAAIIGVGMVILTPIAFQTDSASEQVADYIAGVPSGYGETSGAAAGRAAFESRVDAAVAARRLTRTEATRLKADYQAVIQLETRYQADGVLSASERADLDSRLDALDARVGDSPNATTPAMTARQRLAALDTTVTTSERAGRITRAEAADIRVELGDLQRLETAYARLNVSADDSAYLDRRIGELESRARR